MDAKTAAAIERIKQNKALAESLMRSGDGQQLINMLTRGDNGEALNRAAQDAAKGDTAALSQMLQSLMHDPAAEAVMRRINDKAKQ